MYLFIGRKCNFKWVLIKTLRTYNVFTNTLKTGLWYRLLNWAMLSRSSALYYKQQVQRWYKRMQRWQSWWKLHKFALPLNICDHIPVTTCSTYAGKFNICHEDRNKFLCGEPVVQQLGRQLCQPRADWSHPRTTEEDWWAADQPRLPLTRRQSRRNDYSA
jgi:hypothetical protein